MIKFLATLGVPIACLLHGYVGFIFGAIKANAWWSTPLMPIIFLLSAIVSGIALLLVLYVIVAKIRRVQADYSCISTMAVWLGGFLTVAFITEGLEIVSMLYESEESWGMIRELITDKIALTYFGFQFGLGAVGPLVLLAVAQLSRFSHSIKVALTMAASASVLVGVFAMRWNVVVGGQLISKSLRGFTTYTPPLIGQSSIATGSAMMILPFVILVVILYLLPPWEPKPEPEPQRRAFSFLTASEAEARARAEQA